MNKKYDVVVLSPHLDDAVFSLGQHLIEWIEQGKKIKIINIFTKFGNIEIDLEKYRKEKDKKVMDYLKVKWENWNFTDGGFRLSDKKMLFGGKIIKEDDNLKKNIEKRLKKIKADLVLAPRGVGGHVDHILVREMARKIMDSKIEYYIDLPYLWSNFGWYGKIKSFKLGSRRKNKLAREYGKEYEKVVRRWWKLFGEMIVDYS